MAKRPRNPRISGRASLSRAKFDESKHRRDPGGRFDDKPGAGNVASRRSVGPSDDEIRDRVQRVDKFFEQRGGRVVGLGQILDDPDLEKIMKDGDLLENPDIIRNLGTDGECHWNTGKLYSAGEVDTIVVGYAKNEFGWHQHTWGLKGGKVVETTASNLENTAYLGVSLSPEQSSRFAAFLARPENAPGNGNVRTRRGGSVF